MRPRGDLQRAGIALIALGALGAALAAVMVVPLSRYRFRLREAWPPLLVLAAWLGWLTWAFGSPIPTSGEAKLLEQWISGRFAIPLPILVAAAWSATRLRGQPVARGLIAWLAAYLVGLALLGLPSFSWYYAPAGLAIVLVVCVAAQDTLSRVRCAYAWHAALPPLVPLAFAAAYAVVCAVRTPGPDPALRAAAVNQQAGRWLHAHASPRDSVAAYETGLLAWESDRKVIDVLGLTEPAAHPYLKRGDIAWALTRKPTWVFLERPDWAFPIAQRFDRSPTFAGYAPAVAWAKSADDPYVLYRRTR